MSVEKIWDKLPPWAAGVIAVVAVAGVAGTVIFVYKKLDKTDEEKAAKKLSIENDNEAQKNVLKGQKFSFPASQYVAMANQCYEGMKYGIGDSYGDVRDTLMKMQNDLDVNMIVKAFGKRQAYIFGIAQGEPKDLFVFVRQELGNEYGGLTSYKMDAINNDWSKKGISYKF